MSGLSASKAQRRVQRLMMRAWAAFADDPVRGLERRMGWPRYDPTGTLDFLMEGGFVGDLD